MDALSPSQRRAIHAVSIAAVVLCPALIALPPRKLDAYTLALVSGTLMGGNQLAYEYTSRSIVTRIQDRVELRRQEGLRRAAALESAQAEAEEERQQGLVGTVIFGRESDKKESLVGRMNIESSSMPETKIDSPIIEEVKRKQQVETKHVEKQRSPLEKFWMGGEKSTWKKERDRKEQEALAEGKTYGDIIMDQIWEVWSWGKDKMEEVKKSRRESYGGAEEKGRRRGDQPQPRRHRAVWTTNVASNALYKSDALHFASRIQLSVLSLFMFSELGKSSNEVNQTKAGCLQYVISGCSSPSLANNDNVDKDDQKIIHDTDNTDTDSAPLKIDAPAEEFAQQLFPHRKTGLLDILASTTTHYQSPKTTLPIPAMSVSNLAAYAESNETDPNFVLSNNGYGMGTLLWCNYTWASNSMSVLSTNPANHSVFKLMNMPFIDGFAGQVLQNGLTLAMAANISTDVANMFSLILAQTAISFLVITVQDAPTHVQQQRVPVQVARVPKASLFALVVANILFALLGAGVAVAALVAKGNGDAYAIKLRTSTLGLLAEAFLDEERQSGNEELDAGDEHSPTAFLMAAERIRGALNQIPRVTQCENHYIYITGSPMSSRTILLIYDIFGPGPQTLQGADRLAASLFATILAPDLLQGNEPTRIVATVKEVIKSCDEGEEKINNGREWAGLGLCWGGKRLSREDVEAIAILHIILAAPTDNKDGGVDAYSEVSKLNGRKWVVEAYGGMFHGWMGAKAKLGEEENAREFERAYEHIAKFFADSF
ncbi:hypothetical protein G7Y89_g11457 [Cudoniella acicularis]|uniref:Uncharacterized protein n=1 Tax=Cudoniella acicularis TaxID=354080 RepID=A0A8H4VXU4_9HELO|nr:hypothetical protein G7Y89_g11457 [Cudoniella acicularis]